jgi:sugar phosphate isomerase/epimerase
MYSRRDLVKIALGALPAVRLLAKPNSTLRGISLGIDSISFRDRPLEQALTSIVQAGLSACELWEGHIAPWSLNRKGLREWRESIAIERFQLIANEFNKAGVKIEVYNYDFAEDFSDREMERGFQMAKALGAGIVSCSSPPSLAKRLNGYAAKAGMLVGMRNGDGSNPDAISSPDDLVGAMTGNSNVGVCLDIGDFVAAGYDPVGFIGEQMNRVYAVYLKDRRRDRGASVAWGQGNTPVAAVLRLMEMKRLKAPALIEYDYNGHDTMVEVQRCYTFCRSALTAKVPLAPPSAAGQTISGP